MQLVAGRMAQEFNRRKKRKGAFWEDRYHATAIESGTHLWRCLIYIDLNMVRTGEVEYPRDWPYCGYHEIQGIKSRNTILDKHSLLELLDLNDFAELQCQHRAMIDDAIAMNRLERKEQWTESLAVGSHDFVVGVQEQLKSRGKKRQIAKTGDQFIVREESTVYEAVFDAENYSIRDK